MIESLAKAAETAKPLSQSSETFNPDTRITSLEKNAMQKGDVQKTQSDFKQYDPDRRVEAAQDRTEQDADRYNPDNRIEPQQETGTGHAEKEKTGNPENRQHGLSEEEKKQLKEETGWSDEIIDAIGSKEEAEIYKKAGLKEAEINGKKCLIRDDIDMEQKDEYGRTNKERMENGLAPINKNGETIELHHIGQKADAPLAELTTQEHRGKGNDTILHDKQKPSEIDREAFAKERESHWESRAEQLNG